MSKRYPIQLLAIAFALAAGAISFLLLQKHITGSGGAMFDQGCTVQLGSGKADCGAVLASPYAYFPPKHENAKGGTYIPVAFFGVLYYTALAIWLIGVGRPDRASRAVHLLPIGLVSLGLMGSAYFCYIMFTVLTEWCPWCAVTHVLNLCLAICVFLLWPGRKLATSTTGSPVIPSSGEASDSTDRRATVYAAPSTRQIVLTLLAILIASYAVMQRMGMMRLPRLQSNLDTCMAEVDRIRGDARTLYASWQASKKLELPTGANVPIRGGSGQNGTYEVVVFSDFECPGCAQTAKFLDERIQPMFDGRLRIVYRHYPLNARCNEALAKNVQAHPFACDAARMSIAAFTIGGNDAFWKTHDYLFANQEKLKKGGVKPSDVAGLLGVDAAAFDETMKSESTTARLAEDIKLAQTVGVQSTPAVIVDGRSIPRIARMVDMFWDEMANHFWVEVAKTGRPESTKAGKPTATQGNQGPKGAP